MKRILYIEDDPIQRDVMIHMLELQGFEVEVAENGLQGFEKAIANLPDLILTDAQMPLLNGPETIVKIRESVEAGNTPIIALSARADTAYQSQALHLGANEVFTKPVNLKELIVSIESYVGGQ